MAVESLYELLGVVPNATTGEIRAAFRKKALDSHPDRGGDAALFQRVNKAYDTLSDPERRKYFDRTGRVERSAEEDFLEGFGGREPSRSAAPASNAASSALQHRFTAVANADGDHSTSFDAWMRGRDVDAMVVTTETLLQDKTNIAEASYAKLTLPKKVRTTVIVKVEHGGGDVGAGTSALLARATRLDYRKIPKQLEWKECLVNVAAAPLTPLDLYIAKYGTETLFRDDLQLKAPHVLGCSGVGIVEAVGPGCLDVAEGDWVVPIRDGLGTFSSLGVWDIKNFLKVPKELMPLEYMALHRELALAYYLMETAAAELKPGDALVVNAANGAVGQVVIQLCRLMNVRAIAVVRRHDNFEDTKAWLTFLGAYKVFADDEHIVHETASWKGIEGGPLQVPVLQAEYASLPTLGLDGVGGAGALRMMRSLAPGSTIITYGFVSERNVPIPWQVVVNSRVTIRGFDLLSWLSKDVKKHGKKFVNMLEQMAKLINAGKLRISLTTLEIDQWAQAVAEAEPGTNAKVVFKMPTMEQERLRLLERESALDEARRIDVEARAALRVATDYLFTSPAPPPDADAAAAFSLGSVVPSATLVWLHGNGELPQEYASLFERGLASAFPGVRVVLPTPPRKRATVADPQLWFDLDEATWTAAYGAKQRGGGDLEQADVQLMLQVEESADYIAAVVEAEILLAGGDASTVVVAGFSHGGVVALYAALTKLSKPLGGCIAVGAPCILPGLLCAKARPHLRATPAHFVGGDADATFTAIDQRSIVEAGLAGLPACIFEPLAGGSHEVGSLEIAALANIFAKLVKLS